MRSPLIFLFIGYMVIGCSKSPNKPPVQKDSTILWGSTVWQEKGETKAEAYERVKSAFGLHQIVRYYCAGDPLWPDWLPKETVTLISFKIDAKEVLAGIKDQVLKDFFNSLATHTKIYWTYYHEPEDNISEGTFSAVEYRAAFDYIIDLQKKLNKPNLVPTLCLMSWSLTTESGRNWRDYLPAKVELLSWDGYFRDHTIMNAALVFGRVREIATETGLPWAVAETGVNKMKNSGKINEPIPLETRRTMLTALSKDIKTTRPYPVFVSYFDSDPPQDATYSDWRISDDATMVAAWKEGFK